jgi:acyl-CoA synthetase (AMP-forming)/AMP-acid ligase II
LEEKNIVKSPCKELVLPFNVSLPEFVWEQGIKYHRTNVALINGVTGKSYTYEEGYRECKKFAISLNKLRIGKADVVALFMPNCPEYILCLLGTFGIGAVATTINPNYTAHEVSKQFLASNTKLVVTIPKLINIVKDAIKKIDVDIKVIVLGEEGEYDSDHYQSYNELMSNVQNSEEKEFTFEKDTWDEVALLPYSSGTTGLPKGVILTTKNLVSNVYQNVYGQELNFIKLATDTFQPKIICVLPMFHIFGLLVTSLPTLRAGGQVITIPKFESNLFANTLETFKPTFLHLVPPLVAFCASNEAVTPLHLESVEHIMVILDLQILTENTSYRDYKHNYVTFNICNKLSLC